MKKINLTISLLAVLALFFLSCNGGEKKATDTDAKSEAAPVEQGQSTVIDTVRTLGWQEYYRSQSFD